MATETTTETTLAGNVAKLHQARVIETVAKTIVDESRKLWEEEHATELAEHRIAKAEVEVLEAKIKDEAVAQFNAAEELAKGEGNRHPTAGVLSPCRYA